MFLSKKVTSKLATPKANSPKFAKGTKKRETFRSSNSGTNSDSTKLSKESEKSGGLTSRVSNLLSSLTDAFSGPDETPDRPGAAVAVLDNFKGANEPGKTTHGEAVEAVLKKSGDFKDEDIQRFHVADGPFEGQQGFFGGLKFEDSIANNSKRLLDNTGKAYDEIRSDPKHSQINTTNLSMGISPGTVSEGMWKAAQKSPEHRDMIAGSLGLESPSDKEFLRALTSKSSDVFKNNPKIKASKASYDEKSKQLAEAGVAQVVAVGNSGRFEEVLKKHGIEVGDDFFRSVMLNDHTTAVAATDGVGGAAEYSASGAGAEVSSRGYRAFEAADGESDSGDGSSLAAPDVTATMARVHDVDPSLTPEQREDVVASSSSATKETNRLGAGIVNPNAAYDLAAQ